MHFARTVLCSPGLSVSGIWWKGQIDESCPGKEFLGETRAKIQPEWPPCWCSRDLHHQLFFPRLLCDGVPEGFPQWCPRRAEHWSERKRTDFCREDSSMKNRSCAPDFVLCLPHFNNPLLSQLCRIGLRGFRTAPPLTDGVKALPGPIKPSILHVSYPCRAHSQCLHVE